MNNQTLLTFPECMERAFLLPTQEGSCLTIQDGIGLYVSDTSDPSNSAWHNQHLYICSDAEIKGHCYFTDGDSVYKNTIDLDAYINLYRIEFTTDPLLIADGVPAIDGNTRAITFCFDCQGGAVYCEKCDENCDVEVNFLSEYCKLYNQKSSLENYTNHLTEKFLNQKDNQKVDVEKLAKDFARKTYGEDEKGNKIVYFYAGACFVIQKYKEQALQSNAGGFSLEDMREAYLNNGPPNKEGFDDFIQSLTDKPKGNQH